jgi:hypothetical protein
VEKPCRESRASQQGAMAELENLRDAAFSVHAASAEMADLL